MLRLYHASNPVQRSRVTNLLLKSRTTAGHSSDGGRLLGRELRLWRRLRLLLLLLLLKEMCLLRTHSQSLYPSYTSLRGLCHETALLFSRKSGENFLNFRHLWVLRYVDWRFGQFRHAPWRREEGCKKLHPRWKNEDTVLHRTVLCIPCCYSILMKRHSIHIKM